MDTRVFRMSCELTEKVDPEALQEALDDTAEEFSHFQVFLRKGFFWYYLDGTDTKARVKEEQTAPLLPLYHPGRRNLLYRVNYFEKRINVEFFHVLTDGTGGFAFFQKLLLNYFGIVKDIRLEASALNSSSHAESREDAFGRFYTSQKGRSQLDEWSKLKAYQIRSPLDPNLQSHLMEGVVSAGEFLKLAHERNTTAGILATALYIEAVMETMRLSDKRKAIVIGVPVNLRQYFPSYTTRNFFGSISVPFFPAEYDGNFQSILESVRNSFASQLTMDRLRENMNSYSELTHMPFIRILPLSLKDIGIRYYFARTRKATTSTLSNVGKVVMPPEFAPFIRHFSAFMSTFNLQLCMLTYADRLSFGAVSDFADPSVLMEFFRKLTKLGLSVELGTNDCDRM